MSSLLAKIKNLHYLVLWIALENFILSRSLKNYIFDIKDNSYVVVILFYITLDKTKFYYSIRKHET